MNRKVKVGSTPFIPCGSAAIVEIAHCPIEVIKDIISKADIVESFCGHQQSADYLNVSLNRGEAEIKDGDYWVGICPIRRIMPGEELIVSSETFRGWWMVIHPFESEIRLSRDQHTAVQVWLPTPILEGEILPIFGGFITSTKISQFASQLSNNSHPIGIKDKTKL